MMEIIAVTTQAGNKGCVTRLQAELVGGVGVALQLDNGVVADNNYKRQVEIANDYLTRIVAALPHGLVDTARGNMVIRIRPTEDIDLADSSHGLALLITGLGNVLGLRPWTDRVFSVALKPPKRANVITFDSVVGVAAKARSLGEAGIETLYYSRRSSWQDHEERQIHENNLAFERGDGASRCRAVALPSICSDFNLLNMAFDLADIWPSLRRAMEVSPTGGLQFAAQLLQAATQASVIPDEFPYGLGSFIATLRGQRRVPPDLPEQLALGSFARKASQRQLPEVIKIAISESPDRNVPEDLAIWLSGKAESTDLDPRDTPLDRMMWVLDTANLSDALSPELLRIARSHLNQRIEESIHAAERRKEEFAVVHVLVQNLCALRSRFEGVVEGAHKLLADLRLPHDHPGNATLPQCVAALARKALTPVDLPTASSPALSLVFQDRRSGDANFADGFVVPWPSLVELNPLEVRYEMPAEVKLAIPSPVVLLENSRGQASYARRSGFRLVDDTFSRLPLADIRCVAACFGTQSNRIAFHLTQHTSGSSEEVGINWDPMRVPFPPAIDSQFLVAALQRWAHEHSSEIGTIESVADIGCGTGFLASAACFLFPSVTSVDLVDVDDELVLYAAENLRAWWDQERRNDRSLDMRRHARGFERWKPKRSLDLLVCNPPYLPALHAAGAGIERATNGTELLQGVLRRAGSLSKYTWVVFSTLSWREFELAVAPVLNQFESIIVFERQFVPLRINWIEPRLLEESDERPDIAQHQYEQRAFYYENILIPRGLLDLDHNDWEQDLATRAANSAPALFAGTADHVLLEDRSELSESKFQELLQSLREHSRGFRHWHEIRAVLLVAKERN